MPALAYGFSVEFKDQQVFHVSRILDILALLDNAVVWMVSTCPLISKSTRPFNRYLWIVPSVPITDGITVTFISKSFFFL